MELKGASILITGGRRVGAKLALMLAERGASVAMTYHTSRDAIEKVAKEARAMGVRAEAIAADLTQSKQAADAVEATVRAFGRIDALVNMASVFTRTPFETLTPKEFDAMVATNLSGPAYVAIAAAQQMLKQPAAEGRPQGKIINIGDWASDRPYRNYLPYLVGKGGLQTLTLAMAKELAPKVAVNMIQPAMIEAPPDFTPADIAQVVAQTPLARAGEAGDVNRLILYLLEGTDFVTGACYRVDGGRFLGKDN